MKINNSNQTKQCFLALINIIKTTDENHPLTAVEISRLLSNQGFSAERRSIGRDLHLLEKSGMDIIWCNDNKLGCFLGSHQFDDWELKVMVDALQQAHFLTETACRRISDTLLETTSPSSRDNIKKATATSVRGRTRNKSTQNNIDSLLKAIGSKHQISFQYCTYNHNLELVPRRTKRYQVNPYTLYWDSDFYYLLCIHDNRETLTPYRLDRMRQVKIENELTKNSRDYSIPPEEMISNFLKNSTHHYGGSSSDKILLKLKVPTFMLDHLVDQFGLEFIHPSKDYTVLIETAVTEGLYFWLLQYSLNVQVVSPSFVLKELIRRLEKIRSLYL